MQTIMASFPAIVLWIGVVDAVAILVLGIVASIMYVLGKNMDSLTERVVPAVLMLVGTSAAALVVMMIARWISGLLGA